jgi:rod shape-determining protein MreD
MPVSRQILRPIGLGRILLTLLGAMLLNLLPWQAATADFAPDFVALLLIYWSLNQPRRIGVGAGFLLGLLMDVGDGAILGQHALAYSLIAFLTLWRQRQMAIAPFWQQAFGALLLLLLSQLAMQTVRAALGAPFVGWGYFISPFATALLWTPLSNLMLLHQRREVPDEL